MNWRFSLRTVVQPGMPPERVRRDLRREGHGPLRRVGVLQLRRRPRLGHGGRGRHGVPLGLGRRSRLGAQLGLDEVGDPRPQPAVVGVIWKGEEKTVFIMS